MRVFLPAAALLSLLIPGSRPLPQSGDADPHTKAAVSTLKRAIVDGHRTKDRAALERLYADDYQAIDSKRVTRTKKDLLDRVAAGVRL